MTPRIFLRLRLLERLQNPVSDGDRIRKILESGREAFELVVAEIAAARAGREDQIVVLDDDALAVQRVDEHASPIAVDTGDFPKEHRGVSLLPQNPANRRADLPRTEDGRCDLVEERLEQVEVAAVDHLGIGLAERFRGGQAAEAPAHDHHARRGIRHGYWPSPRDGMTARRSAEGSRAEAEATRGPT